MNARGGDMATRRPSRRARASWGSHLLARLGASETMRDGERNNDATPALRGRRWPYSVPHLRRFANYLTQLRPYSYVDLLLMLVGAGATSHQLLECSLLWFGFLVFLECMHRDDGRELWSWWVWAGLWAIAVGLAQTPWVAPFIMLCVAYAYKKYVPALAASSFIINGGVKATLLLLVPRVSLTYGVVVLAGMAIRNLMGDFRDVEKDRRDGARSIPVRVGLRRDIRWLYPACLALTTLLWVKLGGLPAWTIPIAFGVEGTTYFLTPR